MKRQLIAPLFGFAAMANAHFVFVVPQPGGATAQVFISEDLKPSDEVDVGVVGGTKLTLRNPQGHETPLVLTKGPHAYVAPLSGVGTRLIHGIADLGLTQRGPETPSLIGAEDRCRAPPAR